MTNIVPVRAFKDNYIWLMVDATAQAAWAVDPGDAAPVIDYLREHHLALAGILITHHHADHCGGISNLLNEWKDIPVYGFMHSKVPQLTHFVKENDEINCGQIKLKVVEIPGHTLDHLAFYNDEIVFCGDTLFSAGCGRVFEGTYEQMYHSLNKLFYLPNSIKIYCGHEYTWQNLQFALQVEPENSFIQKKIAVVTRLLAEDKPTLPAILADEKNINPFLRCQESSVMQAAQNNAPNKLANAVEVFKYLREWKNRF